MEIKLLFFGIAKDITQTNEMRFRSNDVLTVALLKKELQQKFMAFEDVFDYAIAVNESYATNEHVLKDGDTVAVIPPVSGG